MGIPIIPVAHSLQVSDKCPPANLVSMIRAFNPDNLPGRLAVVVRMGAAKLRTSLPGLISAVEEAGLVRSSEAVPKLPSRLAQLLFV
jgi:3-deoxy-D-arabino-heptulosonate 7-phosphate (DAHP) synthase class II